MLKESITLQAVSRKMKSAKTLLAILGFAVMSACSNMQDSVIDRYEARLDSFQNQFTKNPSMPVTNTAMYDSLVKDLEASMNELNQIRGLNQEQQERVSLLGIRTQMVFANTLQEAVKASRRGLDSARQQLDSLTRKLESIPQ